MAAPVSTNDEDIVAADASTRAARLVDDALLVAATAACKLCDLFDCGDCDAGDCGEFAHDESMLETD